MPLTDHQELAAESRGGARLVSAAAGSGKTKVLVERLMRYVDRGADIDQFLVITYTRAAAAELRSRILSALGERIAADPMNRRLRRQTELCCRASIGTIDSICGRFLRENTHLAGISPDYRVIEPDRSDEICARVLDKLLEELYETIEEDAGVRALVDSFGSGDNDDKLSALVLRLYKSLQSHADPDAWLAEQRERLTDAWNDAGDTPWGQYLLSRTRSQAQYWAERIEELRLRLDEPDRDAKIKKAYSKNLDFASENSVPIMEPPQPSDRPQRRAWRTRASGRELLPMWVICRAVATSRSMARGSMPASCHSCWVCSGARFRNFCTPKGLPYSIRPISAISWARS